MERDGCLYNYKSDFIDFLTSTQRNIQLLLFPHAHTRIHGSFLCTLFSECIEAVHCGRCIVTMTTSSLSLWRFHGNMHHCWWWCAQSHSLLALSAIWNGSGVFCVLGLFSCCWGSCLSCVDGVHLFCCDGVSTQRQWCKHALKNTFDVLDTQCLYYCLCQCLCVLMEWFRWLT